MATTEGDIERVVTGYNRAIAATDYAATIICDVQLVDGGNYSMVWSTQYNGGFAPNA